MSLWVRSCPQASFLNSGGALPLSPRRTYAAVAQLVEQHGDSPWAVVRSSRTSGFVCRSSRHSIYIAPFESTPTIRGVLVNCGHKRNAPKATEHPPALRDRMGRTPLKTALETLKYTVPHRKACENLSGEPRRHSPDGGAHTQPPGAGAGGCAKREHTSGKCPRHLSNSNLKGALLYDRIASFQL